jgi:hypothetical protein
MGIDLGSVFSTVAPWLVAGLTGGPIGMATKAAGTIATALGIGGSSSTPASVISSLQSLTMTPEQSAALQSAENTFQLQMKQAGYSDAEALKKLDLDEMAAVNATMVAELQNADKESWLEKNWRPLCGLSVAAGSMMAVVGTGAIFAYSVFTKDMTPLNQIPTLATAMTTILAVPGAAVGIMAWHQGVNDVKKTEGSN